MQKVNWNSKLSPKLTALVLIVLVAALVGALVGGVVLHKNSESKNLAEITNTRDFTELAPVILQYNYVDNAKLIDLGNIISVSKGATFSVKKVVDQELITVDSSKSKNIDVSGNVVRKVYVMVTSANGTQTNDYVVVLVPRSQQDNRIVINNGALESIYYSSEDKTVTLPALGKKVYSHSDNGVSFNEFLGWYSDKNMTEDSRIDGNKLTVGEGKIEVYAKYADFGAIMDADTNEFTGKITFGKFPQTLVADYRLIKELKSHSETNAIASGGIFSYMYNGQNKEYLRYKPTNDANISDNGFSSSQYYYFEVEPIEWWILQNSYITPPQSGLEYKLLSVKVLSCSAYSKTTAQSIYDKIPDAIKKLTDNIGKINKYLYGAETMWERSILRQTINSQFNNQAVFGAGYESKLVSRNFDYDTFSDVKKSSDKVYAINYSEAIDSNNGFNPDYTAYDIKRRAKATDYAMAQGVFVSEEYNHSGYSTWWLRSAGETYNETNKRVAYVKFSGFVHAYTATNYLTRSGIRPSVKVVYSA